jgi:hypothetical protein
MSNTERVYFTDSEGTVWRVHDACLGPPLSAPGRHRLVELGASMGSTRYFVNEDRVVRCTPLKRNESRAIDEATLARHFSASGFIAQSPATVPARRAR